MSRPLLHALLNGGAFVLLLFGWAAVRGVGAFAGRALEERRTIHARFMGSALAVSAVFLVSYLQYHYQVGHVPFWGEGWLKTVYLAVLLPHIALAALMVPPILILVVLALRGRIEGHRRLARWTLPVWLYVSVTGVVIYVMNYAMRPA